jgi:transcriptional regulator with XRE-family HTH domain
MNYGRAIKIVRTASGLSQAELAERLTIGASQLSLIEAGKRQPSLKVIHEISDALKVPPHLITLLASGSKNLKEGVDAKDVEDLANALLRVMILAGEHTTLPFDRKVDEDFSAEVKAPQKKKA